MEKLKLCPLLNDYGIQLADEILRTQASNGMPRLRLDNVGLPHTANYSVACDEKDYEYLMAFYEINKTKEFEAKILAYKSISEYHICQFASVPSPKPRGAKKFTCSFQLHARPKVKDKTAMQAIIDNYQQPNNSGGSSNTGGSGNTGGSNGDDSSNGGSTDGSSGSGTTDKPPLKLDWNVTSFPVAGKHKYDKLNNEVKISSEIDATGARILSATNVLEVNTQYEITLPSQPCNMMLNFSNLAYRKSDGGSYDANDNAITSSPAQLAMLQISVMPNNELIIAKFTFPANATSVKTTHTGLVNKKITVTVLDKYKLKINVEGFGEHIYDASSASAQLDQLNTPFNLEINSTTANATTPIYQVPDSISVTKSYTT